MLKRADNQIRELKHDIIKDISVFVGSGNIPRMSTLVLCIIACTAISALTAAVLKYRRKPACADSRRICVSFLNDPLQHGTFYLPEKYIIYNMSKRIKENRVKLRPMWEENKKYFTKIWGQLSLQRKELFIVTLLGEMWELLEPYSMYTRDMKALILPALPMSTLLCDSLTHADDLNNVVVGCIDGKPTVDAPPVCRAYALDEPARLESSISSDNAVVAEAQVFVSTLRELSLSMLLLQVLQRYGREANNSSGIWVELKKSPIVVICCMGMLACVLSICLDI